MHILQLTLASALLATLTGCDTAGTAVRLPDGNAAIDPATLCVSNSCGSKLKLLAIGDAENIQFSDSGRLFVSGGTNVYEITRSGQIFESHALLDGSCNFTGLAIRANTLYANCFNGHLYAAPLGSSAATQAKLADIYSTGLASANGLSEGPDNTLYIVNGPITDDARVVKLTLDPADPLKVTGQVNWLTSEVQMANGIQRGGNTLYIMNSNALAAEGTQILAVPIQPDGSAGPVEIRTHLFAIGDDIALVGDYFLTTEYVTGGASLLKPDGTAAQSISAGTFESPSHIEVTRGPLFKPGHILVTEKGIIGDNDSPIGNALTLFYPSSDPQPIPP